MTARRCMIGAAVAALALAAVACGDDGSARADAALRPPDAGADAAPDSDAAPTPDAAPAADAAPVPDAAPPVAACAAFETPAGILAGFPGSFAGDVNVGAASLDVGADDCAAVNAPLGVSAPGREQVVRLEGLVAGTEYGVQLDAAFDACLYVATACTGDGGPVAGECLVFVDTFANPETATFTQPSFVAPSDGVAYVVVDHWNPEPPDTGGYLLVVAPVECSSGFDCAGPDEVVCGTFTCLPGPDACVGDDPVPPEDGDDGPAGATALALGTPVDAAVCNEPALESDFYVVSLAAGDDLYVELQWIDGAADLDLRAFDAAGAPIGAAASSDIPERLLVPGLPAGDVYLQVDKLEVFEMGSPTTSTDVTTYTITARAAECVWDADCATTGAPICGADATCGAGYDSCTGDDAAENDDDGAGLGKLLAPELDGAALEVDATICSAPAGGGPGTALEADWYAVSIGDGETLAVALSWPGAEDLDLALFDAGGALIDEAATSGMPEMITAAPGAGTYYARVDQYSPIGVATAAPYRLSVQRSTSP